MPLLALSAKARLIVPVGEHWQELLALTRTETGMSEERLFPVAFVPMTGEAQRK